MCNNNRNNGWNNGWNGNGRNCNECNENRGGCPEHDCCECCEKEKERAICAIEEGLNDICEGLRVQEEGMCSIREGIKDIQQALCELKCRM